MLAEERHREILASLGREGSVRVTTLAQRFSVTEETIRRDLDKLQDDGMLTRIHGGALLSGGGTSDTPFWHREHVLDEEKAAIARVAVQRVKAGDRLLLDSSSTAWFLAREIPTNLLLTVLTNSLQVAAMLNELPEVAVIVLGGNLSKTTLGFSGPTTEDALSRYQVDRLFLSCQHVNARHGLTDGSESRARLREKMIEASAHTTLLVDHSKLGGSGLARFGSLSDVDELVVDARVDNALLEPIRESGVAVTVAPL